MVADYKLKDYYLEYTCDCKNKILECEQDIIKIKEKLNILYDFLKNNEDRILSIFKLDLKNYDIEYNKMLYNENKLLYNDTIKLIKNTSIENKNLLIQILKYLNLLSQINIKEHDIRRNSTGISHLGNEHRIFNFFAICKVLNGSLSLYDTVFQQVRKDL